jgi:hypothetical protein
LPVWSPSPVLAMLGFFPFLADHCYFGEAHE